MGWCTLIILVDYVALLGTKGNAKFVCIENGKKSER